MTHDLIIVGAGPVGVAALWRAAELDLDAVALERGRVCDAIRRYPVETVFHSTAPMLAVGPWMPETLDGEQVGPAQVVEHFERLRQGCPLPVLEGWRVDGVERGEGCFTVHGSGGSLAARALILATGHYDAPRSLGVPGEELPFVEHALRPARDYQGQRVAIIGGSFSAQEAAEKLVLAGAKVSLLHRGSSLVQGSRPERAQRLLLWAREGRLDLRLGTRVLGFEAGLCHLQGPTGPQDLVVDRALLQLGYWADTRLAREAGVAYGADAVPQRQDADGAVTGVPRLHLVGAACNGELKGNRIGMKSGLPQARLAVEALARSLSASMA
jgi:thioredoxin reductase (NADPH)